MKKKHNSLFLLFGLGIIFSHSVFAQGTSLGISPVSFELTGEPGDVIENFVKVYNPSPDSVVGVKMEVEDISPTGETGGVVVEAPETESYSLARWIYCEPREFDLHPKEEKTVKFTIRIPENAEPGGHYGSVLAGAKGIAGGGGTGALVVQRVGALVLLTVPGEMIEKLTVKEFSAPRYSEYGPIPFTLKFENQGTVHVKPVGSITIADFMGKKIAEVEFSSKTVLPDAIRKIEAEWNKKWLLGGKYTATLSGTYGRREVPFSSVVITFWAFPWKIGLGILGLIILLIITRRRWAAAFRILIKGERGIG